MEAYFFCLNMQDVHSMLLTNKIYILRVFNANIVKKRYRLVSIGNTELWVFWVSEVKNYQKYFVSFQKKA